MSEKCYGITNGTYTLQETGEQGKFHFYRNDGKVLEQDVGRMPIELYQAFITNKMFKGEITEIVAMNVYYDRRSTDGKAILVEAYEPGTEPWKDNSKEGEKKSREQADSSNNQESKNIPEQEKPSFWERIVKKIFGWLKRKSQRN